MTIFTLQPRKWGENNGIIGIREKNRLELKPQNVFFDENSEVMIKAVIPDEPANEIKII